MGGDNFFDNGVASVDDPQWVESWDQNAGNCSAPTLDFSTVIPN